MRWRETQHRRRRSVADCADMIMPQGMCTKGNGSGESGGRGREGTGGGGLRDTAE